MSLDSIIRLFVNVNSKQAEDALGQLTTIIKGVISYEAIKRLTLFSAELVKMGENDLRMEKAFSATAKQIGVDSNYMLDKLKSATRGMVEASELQMQANKALLNSYSPNEIIAWTELATNYAMTMGMDVSETLDRVFTSLAMGNERALRQMGITTKVVNGQVTADLREITNKSKELGAAIGSDDDSPVVQMQKLITQFNELKGELGKELIPVANKLLSIVNDTVVGWEYLFGKRAPDVSKYNKGLSERYALLTAINNEIKAAESKSDFNKANASYVELLDMKQKQLKVIADYIKGKDASVTNMNKRLPGGGGDGGAAAKKWEEIRQKGFEAAEEDNKATLEATERAKKYEDEKAASWQRIVEMGAKAAEEDVDATVNATNEKIKKDKEYLKWKEEQKYQEIDKAISTAEIVNNALASISDAQADKEIKNLDRRHMSQKKYDAAVARIEAQRVERNRKFARVQQAVILAQTISGVSQAFVNALKDNPPIYKWIDAAAVAVAGAAQIATIQAQHFQTGRIGAYSRTRQGDFVPALLGEGESVISAPQTAMHRDLLEAIQNNTANTASGLRGLRGGNTYVFNSPSNEVVTEIMRSNTRLSRTGTPR